MQTGGLGGGSSRAPANAKSGGWEFEEGNEEKEESKRLRGRRISGGHDGSSNPAGGPGRQWRAEQSRRGPRPLLR